MKSLFVLALGVMVLGLFSSSTLAAEKAAKTISGKSDCATCSGVTKAGHNIMLTDKDGERWVLIGDSESYKKAHEVRHDEKKMTATLAGEPVTKKDDNGKEYKEVKVSDVKVEG
jgi:hypothetical protein